MTDLLRKNKDYAIWLKQLKARVLQVQLSAALKVNQELLLFYWDLGEDILKRQKTAVWGDGFLNQLSRDLSTEFPDMKGFSRRNLELIRQWRGFWHGEEPIAKQLVSQLPWGHNLVIISKAKSQDEARFYARKTLEHGWPGPS
jgi:predicted nuclease of restriction endonuclease-like (RecB) superfamily